MQEESSAAKISDEEIRRELEHALGSASFKNSKRHLRFLRFIVEKTLAGNAHEIKERTIGIEVFDRAPDYDLASDPIVRVAAVDIRKRLAQYYSQEGDSAAIRLGLPTGSYVPNFTPNRPRFEPISPAPTTEVSRATPAPETPTAEEVIPNKPRWILVAASTILLVLIAALSVAELRMRPQGLDRLWNSMLGNGDEPLICVGDLNFLVVRDQPDPKRLDAQLDDLITVRNHVGQNDLGALARIASMLGHYDKPFHVSLADDAELTELRSHPTVFIGGFDNRWTTELLQSSRFQLRQDQAAKVGYLIDTTKPNQTDWAVNFRQLISVVNRDYGLITKMDNPLTGHPDLLIAGIGPYGTAAASEFVTNAKYFKEFASQAPRGWENRSIQIVIGTDVVNGRSGPPKMITYDVR